MRIRIKCCEIFIFLARFIFNSLHNRTSAVIIHRTSTDIFQELSKKYTGLSSRGLSILNVKDKKFVQFPYKMKKKSSHSWQSL